MRLRLRTLDHRRMTVRRQLQRLIFVVIAAVVFLMSAAFFLFEYVSYHKEAVERVYPLAETLGIHLRPTLMIANRPQAREILSTTAAYPEIAAVYLFGQNNRPFSYYKRSRPFVVAGSNSTPDNLLGRHEVEKILAAGARDYRIAHGYLAVFVPIRQDGQKLGTLYLVLSLQPLYARILLWLLCAAAIVATVIPVAAWLASKLTRGIVEPVSALAAQMAQVSAGELPGALEAPSIGELGVLVEGFNAMLERIAAHEQKLAEAHTSLEERVRSRTAELRQSEARYRSLFDSSPISLWEEDLSAAVAVLDELKATGVDDLADYLHNHPEVVAACAERVRVIDVNSQTLSLYHAASRSDLFGNLARVFTPSSFANFAKELIAIARSERSTYVEGTNRTLDGNEIEVAVHMSVVPGHEHDYSRVVISVEDITQRKAMETQLRSALGEKELLIQEVHHRVKNNLQIISSLINLQAKKIQDEAARQQLQSTQLRIRAMALIHDKLFRPNADGDRFENFVRELSQEIGAIFDAEQRGIVIHTDIRPTRIEFEHMMVFAMIMNELLSNALKHAFPQDARGAIRISLGLEAESMIVLQVSDDGVGLPDHFVPSEGGSLGYRLIDSLTRQLHGLLEVDGRQGTNVTIRALPR